MDILLGAAVIALAIGTAIQYILLRELNRDIAAIRNSIDSTNAALKRIEGMIGQNEKTSEQQEAPLTRAVANVRASVLLPEIDVFLSRAEAAGQWQFKNSTERAELSRKLKLQIRPTIVSEMEARPETPDTEVRKRMEQLVAAGLDVERKLLRPQF